MYTIASTQVSEKMKSKLYLFLVEQGDFEVEKEDVINSNDFMVIVCDEDDEIIASAKLEDNIVKWVAIERQSRGNDLASMLIKKIREYAFNNAIDHLMLYTEPKNRYLFEGLMFYKAAQTKSVILMESQKDAMERYIKKIKNEGENKLRHSSSLDVNQRYNILVGSIVMNCNPFTLGHRYLVERASSECDMVYVFVLSEDKSYFTANDRFELVKRGTSDLNNVVVVQTGPYLVSQATFPDYFINSDEVSEDIHCELDIEIFSNHFAKSLGISRRYIGTEPYSKVTARYNEILIEELPKHDISVVEIPRKELGDEPISASRVRELFQSGNMEEIKKVVPISTFEYLMSMI